MDQQSPANAREQRNEPPIDEQLYTYRWIRFICKAIVIVVLFSIILTLFFFIAALVLAAVTNGQLRHPAPGLALALLISVPVTISVYRQIDRRARKPREDALPQETADSKEM